MALYFKPGMDLATPINIRGNKVVYLVAQDKSDDLSSLYSSGLVANEISAFQLKGISYAMAQNDSNRDKVDPWIPVDDSHRRFHRTGELF